MRSFFGSLLAALAAVALAVSSGSTLTAVPIGEPGRATLTTQLEPGWNMAAWLGADTQASELFDTLPELRSVWAWDGDHQRYVWATRDRHTRGLAVLTTGAGLWLQIDGDEPVEWARPVAPDATLLSLHEGRNLVGWAGADQTPFSEVATHFGDTLVRATRWDATAQRFEHYFADAPAAGMDLSELNRGDAFWLVLSADARWWRSGTGQTVFEFPDDLPVERQVEIRDALAEVIRFFAESYGIEPPRFAVTVDPRLDVLAYAHRELVALSDRAARGEDMAEVLAHEYFHVLQANLVAGAEEHFESAPLWLHEGSAEYARGLFAREHGSRTGEQQRSSRWLNSAAITAGLQSYEGGQVGSHQGGEYILGPLAVEWLEGYAAAARAGERSFDAVARGWPDSAGDAGAYIRFYRFLSFSDGWEQAFEAAFGLRPSEFYEEFEAYRTDLTASRLPHLADDHNEPFLVLLGDFEEAAAATVREDFDGLQALFAERFGGPAADYSIFFVGSGQSGTEALESRFGWDPGPPPVSLSPGVSSLVVCVSTNEALRFMVVFHRCRTDLPDRVASLHFKVLRDQLVRGEWTPSLLNEASLPGPYWLHLGTEAYAEYARTGLAGDLDAEWLWSRFASAAVSTTAPLDSADRWSRDVGYFASRALGFLASDWLADQVGEASLLDYYRQQPSSTNWHEAFEGAFGMTVDAFYTAFEAYREDVVDVIPHLVDDRAEPVLVIAGEMSEGTAAAVRAEFETAQSFFRDRLGAGPADYTAYVAAETASVTRAFMMAYWEGSGSWPRQPLCHWKNGSVALLVTLDCGKALAHHIPDYHFLNSLLPVAHHNMVPATEPGLHHPWGPDWLWRGLQSYVKYAYLEAAGFETLDETRRAFARLAVETSTPLRDTRTYAPTWRAEAYIDDRYDALAFFAADRLIDHAGESAIYGYFRSLAASESWRLAFEATFGLSVDDFHEDFEEYRATFEELAAAVDGQ